MNGDGRSRPLLQTEPNAHATGATSSATSAVGDAVSELPALSQSTPTKPMPRPSHSRRLERCPRSVANSPIHSGTDATATAASPDDTDCSARSEEHTSELQSLMRISYAVFCLKKKTYTQTNYITKQTKIT